jgi:Spy/CpxP family protein refolding chaperone
MNRILLLACAACALWPVAPLAAQTPPDARARLIVEPFSFPTLRPANPFTGAFVTPDPLAGAFFPPELVMKHQQAIGLTAEQRTAIVAAITAAQPRFIEAQWQLEPETALLAELVRAERVDETRVLQQVDRVLELERQVKRLQLELLVRIKNQLTAEQQRQLTRLGGTSTLRYSPGGAFDTDVRYRPPGAFDFRPGGVRYDSPGSAFLRGSGFPRSSGFRSSSGAKLELDGTAWSLRK